MPPNKKPSQQNYLFTTRELCYFRFILDSPSIFKDETVLDVGSGCGASAIAAKLARASRVVANDTDQGNQTSAYEVFLCFFYISFNFSLFPSSKRLFTFYVKKWL